MYRETNWNETLTFLRLQYDEISLIVLPVKTDSLNEVDPRQEGQQLYKDKNLFP